MAYRSLIEESPHRVKQVIRSTFDFNGRATRSDGVVYYLFVALVSWALGFVILATPLGSSGVQGAMGVIGVVIQLPLVAWLVRRAHDYGLSGFWLLPLLFWFLAAGLPAQLIGIDLAEFRQTLAFRVASIGIGIAFLCAALWKPSEGSNRFGPNPRYGTTDDGFGAA